MKVLPLAVACGWQATVAYINIGCYYLIVIPLGVLLGFKFDFGVKVHCFSPSEITSSPSISS
jgi:hypothetical protein